ncbi:MAG: dienelactone hydrolase family protein [Acidobacteria bacterium]|nr:dienelactone hydrolase family protein [Acidobacteriota bacterium]
MSRIGKTLLCAVFSLCLVFLAAAQNAPAPTSLPLAPGISRVTSPPVGASSGQSRRAGADPVDDRVEIREYGFKETNENIPYAVFVSSKITKGQKAPLVLALHGYLGNYGTFMRSGCVEEAEKNGYILVGVMGYSPTAPFGNANMFSGRRGPGPTPGPAIAGPPKVMPGARGPVIGGTKETEPAKVSELSEIDTMRVLELVRKEFNIDDNRIFLMGHSMGGAGALYIGEKYAPIWAAVACIAGFGSPDPKGKLKDTPLYFTAGSEDTLGAMGRTTAEQLKAAGLDVQWKEIPGLDHGSIIAGSMPDVFNFFNEHPKKAVK